MTIRNSDNRFQHLCAALLSAGLLLAAMTAPAAAAAISPGIAVPLLPEDAAGGDAAVQTGLRSLPREDTDEYSEPDETSITEPPFPPETPVPPSGAADVPADITLQWSAEETGQYPVRYMISLGRGSLPEEPVARDLEETEYDPQNLTPGVTYAWQVTATDGDMYAIPGEVWTFTVRGGDSPGPDAIIEPPQQPDAPFPANGATGVPVDTELAWHGGNFGQYPLLYTVTIGKAPTPGEEVVTEAPPAAYRPETLEPGTTYSWQVTATDGDMYYISGEVWTFTTAASDRA